MGVLQKVTFYSHVNLDFAHLEKEELGQNSNIFVDAYKPVANNYTRSLVSFENGVNSQSVSDDALGYTFSIYRLDEDGTTLRPISSKNNDKLSIVDYNVRNQKKYQYYIFKEDSTSISKALLSNEITTCWWDYSISGLTLEDVATNTYKINTNDVWLFQSNIESDSTSQNFAKTTYQNLTKYPQISTGKSNYASGSFSALIGKVENNDYKEDVLLLDKWNEFCSNNQLKLFKDRKGHKYIVDVTTSSNNTLDETRQQATVVTVGWTQIDDADEYIIIGD